MQNLMDNLINIIKADERIFSEGNLLKNKLTELALKLDPVLLTSLLGDKKLKEGFFVATKANEEKLFVFDRDKFIDFINNKEFLPDSFTSFKNRIGLMSSGEYIKERDKVVLAWPYKDCVLEGGQDKEDQNRDEIFYNEVLAPDEIDRLFEEKVLANFKRIDAKGEHKLENLTDTDNLIIKGNNLLALNCLKQKFRGQVKLIYIDPPYNTGNDEFKYNDSFNHSTWFTFMKNRLEIARELLSEKGAIFVSVNHIELGYLLVLMDEIFGRANKLPIVTLRSGTTASYRSINECPVNVSEYVVGYKASEKHKLNPVYIESDYTEDYSHLILNLSEDPKKWRLQNLNDYFHKKEDCKNWREFKKIFGISWKNIRFEMKKKFAFENPDKVVSLNTLQKPSEKILQVIDLSKKDRDKVHVAGNPSDSQTFCFNGRTLAFFQKKFREINGEKIPSEILTNIWEDVSFLGIGPEGDVDLPNGKKPELLIKHLIDLVITDHRDIVMDFHLGTGTTCAVAHKMKKRYIGIEQIDYDNNDSIHRLKNVICGDKSGISEDVNWTGGDSFVYFELKELNESYITDIKKADTTKALVSIYEKMRKEAFFRYEVDLSKFEEKEFSKLPLKDKKKTLIECLDKNHLYVNYGDIDDSTYKVSAEDKKLNKEFYGF